MSDIESTVARLRGELAGVESAYEGQRARAEKAERELAHLQMQVKGIALARSFRALAYELVERELRERGITRVNISQHVVCAIRHGADETERAPMPTLLGSVDLLGWPKRLKGGT